MFTLIRCDSTSNKIILSYSYEITFLPLLRFMRQFKSCNLKDNRNIHKWERHILGHKHILNFFPLIFGSSFLIFFYLHKSSLISSLMLFFYINIHNTDLIFEESPINTPRGFCIGIYSIRVSYPSWKDLSKEKSTWSRSRGHKIHLNNI